MLDEGLSSLNCVQDSKIGEAEEDRLEFEDTMEVREVGAAGRLGVIR